MTDGAPRAGGRLRRQPGDKPLGAAVLLLIVLGAFLAGGIAGPLYLLWLWIVGSLVLRLWSLHSRGARVCAAIMLPAVLLTWLLPKQYKQAIRRLDGTAP